jgi:3-oxoacyl-[acyl-carrier-protein] synthase-1
MIFRLADNITSPLGETTAENYQAVKTGRSALARYTQKWGVPEPFTSSLFTDEQICSLAVEGFSRFESLAFRSASKAIKEAQIDVTGSNVVFILSSAKANVECLSATSHEDTILYPGAAAKRIAERLGFTTEPLVVCNACISGVSAILLALRLLDARLYDFAVICGADVQSKFTISGFQSLKAVSENECRPFDIERIGLNLGEAAATLVVGHEAPAHRFQSSSTNLQTWSIRQGAIRNDAFHISSPSKNGEGARLALEVAKAGVSLEDLALVNAHGTATMFNDQMESVAIERAGLADVPVNALKGYFGHTLGAAGILETLITMAALDDNTIVATRGFYDYGVSGKIHLSSHNQPATKTSFIKMISGFGGGNGAILVEKHSLQCPVSCHSMAAPSVTFTKTHSVHLTSTSLTIDGQPIPVDETGARLLTSLYKKYVGDYPKYYKMDGMSRLGFVSSELLLLQELENATGKATGNATGNATGKATCRRVSGRFVEDPLKGYGSAPAGRESADGGHLRAELGHVRPMVGGVPFLSCDSRAVILFNHSTSIVSDLKYLQSIARPDDYYPSPSVFIYTLPSIVTGEIAMRNNYHGETSFYILERRDDVLVWQILCASFADQSIKSIIGGWIDYEDDNRFEADIYIVEQK